MNENNLIEKGEGTLLRDKLAADRTILANERTLLSYIRTALTLIVAGVTFIHFFQTPAIVVLGWVFLPLGAAALGIGLWRYRKMHADIKTGTGKEAK